MVPPKLKRHLNAKNTLSDHDNIRADRNLNETERLRSEIGPRRNFNAPKIYEITIPCKIIQKTGRKSGQGMRFVEVCTENDPVTHFFCRPPLSMDCLANRTLMLTIK